MSDFEAAYVAFLVGTATFVGFCGLRWLLHRLGDWWAGRQARRDRERWRQRLATWKEVQHGRR